MLYPQMSGRNTILLKISSPKHASSSQIILKDLKPRIRKTFATVLLKGNLDWKDLFPSVLFLGITAQINRGHVSHKFVTIRS